MKTLRLRVLDRLMLPQLLPSQGGKIEMLLTGSILAKIEFSAEEIREFGLKDGDGGVSWTGDREIEFEFTGEQAEVLKNASKNADNNKLITRQNLRLIEMIDAL